MVLALTACLTGGARAAPYVPTLDSEVLERLPTKANDPVARELRALRAALKADPNDPERAVALARRYFDLASAEGDPRYIGYAEAAIRPWTQRADPPTEIVFTRALISQYRHEFAPAMADLDTVLARDPAHGEALSWKWALYMVQAHYARAREVCERRKLTGTPLGVSACFATVDSITGKARKAYTDLSVALAGDPDREPEFLQWILTRLGEIALRMGDTALAERHFREAIATGITDGYVLAAYADLLLDGGRHAEAIALLKTWTSSDVLLLRLALAEHALGSPDAPARIQTLADRFAASSLRGDRLHLQDEARFELVMRKNFTRALELASDNWKLQHEPRDARMLFEAAIAARKPEAARGALDWMRDTGYEEPRYRVLADTLRKMAP